MTHLFTQPHLAWTSAMIPLLVGAILYAGITHAQTTPQFLVSWLTTTYTPPGYTEKALPVLGAPITVSFELLRGDTLENLSDRPIRFSIDGALRASGKGKQSFTFIATRSPGSSHEVRIQVEEIHGLVRETIVRIPVQQPTVHVSAPIVLRTDQENTYLFEATPYFFTIQHLADLAFSWSLNGETIKGTGIVVPNIFTLHVPSESVAGLYRVSLATTNTTHPSEQAFQSSYIRVPSL